MKYCERLCVVLQLFSFSGKFAVSQYAFLSFITSGGPRSVSFWFSPPFLDEISCASVCVRASASFVNNQGVQTVIPIHAWRADKFCCCWVETRETHFLSVTMQLMWCWPLLLALDMNNHCYCIGSRAKYYSTEVTDQWRTEENVIRHDSHNCHTTDQYYTVSKKLHWNIGQ